MLKSYPYQADIIKKCLDAKGNVLVMLPTGGGKTHIASMIANKSKKILFIAPKINLIDQTIESFKHLSPQLIHGLKEFDESKNVFVSTIQTISKRPHLLSDMAFDTIIIDEVHYGSSGKMQEVIKSYHKGRFIGLSATPYDNTGKLLEGYDTILQKYDMRYLIDNKYLTPVEAVCPFSVDLKGIKTTAGDYNQQQLDTRMSSPEMVAKTVDATVDVLKDMKKTIVFCVSIEHSEKIATAYRQIFKAKGIKKNIRTLHSHTEKDKRAGILERFADENGSVDILVSVDMITTGFNAPPTDSMVVARPTKSQNLYKQMVGRGTRNYKGKKYCLMLDCGNVVENLGMPLDPIKPMDKKATEIIREIVPCPDCGSKKPKRIREDGQGGLVSVCGKCGGNEEAYLGKHITECDYCNFMHTYGTHKKHYIINQFGIALKCKGCNKITPLVFFKPTGSNEFTGKEYGMIEIITEYIMQGNEIFFEEIFREHISRIVSKKKRTYINKFFGKKRLDAVKILEEIVWSINYDEYLTSINSLSGVEVRGLFVDFCNRYIGESKKELTTRVGRTEDAYYKKYGKFMDAEMYRKSAVHYVNYVRTNGNK